MNTRTRTALAAFSVAAALAILAGCGSPASHTAHPARTASVKPSPPAQPPTHKAGTTITVDYPDGSKATWSVSAATFGDTDPAYDPPVNGKYLLVTVTVTVLAGQVDTTPQLFGLWGADGHDYGGTAFDPAISAGDGPGEFGDGTLYAGQHTSGPLAWDAPASVATSGKVQQLTGVGGTTCFWQF